MGEAMLDWLPSLWMSDTRPTPGDETTATTVSTQSRNAPLDCASSAAFSDTSPALSSSASKATTRLAFSVMSLSIADQ